MGVSRFRQRDLDVLDATFTRPDLTTFCRLDDLGLEVVGQHLETDRAVLACRVREPDPVVPSMRLLGRPTRQRHPEAGARAVRVAADGAARRGLPLPVLGVPARVAPGHLEGGRAAGQVDPRRAALGAGRDRLPAPDVARVAEALAGLLETPPTTPCSPTAEGS